MASRASRIANVLPGDLSVMWQAAQMPDRPAPTIRTSTCSVATARKLHRCRVRGMSDFTITNLMELDDVAAGRAEGIEARMGRSAMEGEQVGVSHFSYGPGVRSPYGHKHAVQEDAYVVVRGSGRIKLED